MSRCLPCSVANALSEIYPISRRALHTQTGFVSLAGFTASVGITNKSASHSRRFIISRLLCNFTSRETHEHMATAFPGCQTWRIWSEIRLPDVPASLFIPIQEQCLKYRSGLKLTPHHKQRGTVAVIKEEHYTMTECCSRMWGLICPVWLVHNAAAEHGKQDWMRHCCATDATELRTARLLL